MEREAAPAAGTVCLTFDFDALSLWVARGVHSPGPLSRGEFGVHVIPRLLHLLERERIEATFFIPGHTVETYPEACRQIVERGHEVALHGYLHEAVSRLDREQERDVLRRSADVLTRLVGRPPRGNRTPSWDYTPNTVELLLELGVAYDSSLMSTDYTPFFARAGDEVPADGPARFGRESGLVQLPVSWSLDDYPAFEYMSSGTSVLPGLRRADDVFENWLDDVRYMVRDWEDGVCVVTCHPQVIGRGHRLLGLERLIHELRTLGVGFEPMARVAEQFRGGRRYGAYRPRPPE